MKTQNNKPGFDRLWLWFGLSRASWLTLPRCLMHEMPDDWQNKMAELLEEYEATFNKWPEGIGSRVQITDSGRLTCLYNWLNDYKHPNLDKIESLKTNNKK